MSEPVWKPPESPDPLRIHQEASYDDPRAGRFAVALAKHVWFHEHALEIEPHLSAVRVSFALSAWKDLGEKYPPAMAALRGTQQVARERALRGEIGSEIDNPFRDFVAICRVLGEDDDAVAVFRALDSEGAESARHSYVFIERVLLKHGEYSYFNKYCDVDLLFPRIAEGLKYSLKRNGVGVGKLVPGQSQSHRINARYISKLISLLVANGRTEEARQYAEEARALWDDPEYLADIEQAEGGASPEQFT